MTSNLSPACNMSLTQYVRLVDGPTTIVCDTFQEIASGAVMIFSVGLFADCIENRADAGPSPCSHEHSAVQNVKSDVAV